ncbi:hypothetical protein PF008_g3549 [Phytophthora fragariae]|uniref:Secreted protein n=1 Tax=Phytophthora fragariae TaxID=53985 RepID=A0A6G0SFV8_9STRA|nr:hypothetical protein PF008_g3549 [Phytophthora fragariae]
MRLISECHRCLATVLLSLGARQAVDAPVVANIDPRAWVLRESFDRVVVELPQASVRFCRRILPRVQRCPPDSQRPPRAAPV